MTNEVSLKFLLDQLKALINETKEINRKNKNTNEHFDSMEDQMSEEELEYLQEQFEDADLYYPEEDFSHALVDLAVPLESVLGQIDNNNSTIFLQEVSPVPVAPMSPTDLVLVCSTSAPPVQSSVNNSASGYDHCSHVDALTFSGRFAQHAALCSSGYNTGHKQWKPGLCLS